MVAILEQNHNKTISSPEYIKTSLASAIGLRFRSGRFYRDAKPLCINLLLSYPDNCYANCAYCGLARSRPHDNGEKSFIRVDWPVLKTEDVIERIERYQSNIRRVCVSMVTHKNAVSDTFSITKQIAQCCHSPISVLITPNLMNKEDLVMLKEIGADTIGIGLDAASKRVFELTRGKKVNGGLVWARYWEVLEGAVDVFGREKISCHIMVGIGETDSELVEIFFKLQECGALAHLFSFYPEPDSTMSLRNRPSLRRFRRIQLVRYLIENEIIKEKHLLCDGKGKISKFLISNDIINRAIESGKPFITGGCEGENGEIGCNRPFGSYRPGESFRDFPFQPESDDILRIKKETKLCEIIDKSPLVPPLLSCTVAARCESKKWGETGGLV